MQILFILLLFVSHSFSSTLEVLEKSHYETISHFEYTELIQNNESPLSLKDRVWKKEKKSLDLSKSYEKKYWIKFKIENKLKHQKTFYLMDERRYIYSLVFNIVKNNTITTTINDGYFVNINNSAFNSSLRLYPIELKANESIEIFIEMQNYNQLDTPYLLVDKEYLIEYLPSYNSFHAMIFAIIFAMGIFNLWMYLRKKDEIHLYYTIYSGFFIFYQVNYFGYSYRYNIEIIPIYLQSLIGGMGFLTFVVYFFKELLNLKVHLPIVNRLLIYSMKFLTLLAIVFIVSLNQRNFYYSELFFNILTLFIPIYIGLIAYSLYYLTYKKINDYVKYYAMIWTILCVAAILLVLMHLNIVSTIYNMDYYFEVAIFLESILFSAILTVNQKLLFHAKMEKEKSSLRKSKFEEIKELLRSLAHQWRQPLSEINGTILRLDIDYRNKRLDEKRFENYLNDVEETTMSLSNLMNDFNHLDVSKIPSENFYLIDMIRLAIRTIPIEKRKKIRIAYNQEEATKIYSLKSKLIESLVIILENSLDAFEKNPVKHPIIHISIQKKHNQYSILVEDNAGGVSNEILPKIYNPYFTTKHQKMGVGLSLYQIKLFIENILQGKIDSTNTDKGLRTIFTI